MDGAWTAHAQAKYDFRKDMKDKRDSHDHIKRRLEKSSKLGYFTVN